MAAENGGSRGQLDPIDVHALAREILVQQPEALPTSITNSRGRLGPWTTLDLINQTGGLTPHAQNDGAYFDHRGRGGWYVFYQDGDKRHRADQPS